MNKISLEEFNNLIKLEEMNDFKDNSDNVCLICQDVLTENNITLECGHRFNYSPLLNEIKYQKLNNNPLEYRKLKIYQIKCPYCRNIQDKILPCYTSEKIYGVNYPDKYCMKPFKCCYIMKSGVRKGEPCNKESIYEYCNKHKNNNNTQNCCNQILKSGKNKGKECMCKIYKNNLCKRHYTMLNK